MKVPTATTLMVAALFIGVPVASAQNSTPTPKVSPSPSNINKGVLPTKPSGAEAPRTAARTHSRIAGGGKYCKRDHAGGPLHCLYASMTACQKHNKASGFRCMANPKSGA